MSDRRSNPASRVTLEDLLRLKRAERPAPEFWVEFERELRQKQLAALVEKRSWWHEFAAIYNRLGGLRLPVGATAVLAVTMLSVHYYSRLGSEPSVVTRSSLPVGPETRQPVSPPQIAAVVAAPAPAVAEAPGQPPPVAPVASATVAEAPRSVAEQGPALSTRLGGVLENPADAAELTPSVHSMSIQLPNAATMDAELLGTAGRALSFEDRAMPATLVRHTAEALPTAKAATEPLRSRMIAALGSAFAYTPEPSAPEYTKRSIIRHLAEDGWDRSMSRLEAGGDRLSIRF